MAGSRHIVVTTKVRPPRHRNEWVRRDRLISTLKLLVDRRVAVITAPAGYGKTVLVADFAHDVHWPLCWYRIGSHESSIMLFLECLIASIEQRFPGACSQSVIALRSSDSTTVESVTAMLVNEIDAHILETFLLVLDDFHEVDEALAINESVNMLLTFLPPNCKIVLASRRKPRWLALARLAAAGELIEIDQSALQFTGAETAELMMRRYGRNLSDGECDSLVRVSEGWVGALAMAGERLLESAVVAPDPEPSVAHRSSGSQPSGSEFPPYHRLVISGSSALSVSGKTTEIIEPLVRVGATRIEQGTAIDKRVSTSIGHITDRLSDYFASEVFDNETVEVQSFLLATAILEEMTPELCNEVLGRADSDAMLRAIESRNLFVELIDSNSMWYRYHQLFREFLLGLILFKTNHAATTSAPTTTRVEVTQEVMLDYHRRAAEWQRINGNILSAIRHLIAAGEANDAARTMSDEIDELYVDGYYLEVIRLVSSLSYSLLRMFPRLLYRLGGAYESSGNLLRAIEACQYAVACCEDLGDPLELANSIVARGTCYRIIGDLHRAMDDSRRAILLTDNTTILTRANQNLAVCYLSCGDVDMARETFHEALRHSRADTNRTVVAHTYTDLSMFYQVTGDNNLGMEYALAAVQCWKEIGQPGGLSLALNNLGTACHAQGRRQEAECYLREATKQAIDSGIRRVEALALVGLADLASESGDYSQAESLYSRGVALARSGRGISLIVYGLTMWAETLRLQGDIDRAQRYVEEAQAQLEDCPLAFESALVSHVAGTLSLDRGDLKQAAHYIEAAIQGFKRLGSRRETVRSLLYRSAVATKAGTGDTEFWRKQADEMIASYGCREVFEVELVRIGKYQPQRVGEAPREAWTSVSFNQARKLDDSYRDVMLHKRSISTLTGVTAFALGPPVVYCNGILVKPRDWQTQPARDMFFYLIDHPHGLTRGDMMLAFWPDSPPERAKSALHSTMSRIRRALGKTVVQSVADRCFIDQSLDFIYDVSLFYSHLKKAVSASSEATIITELEQAIALVRGEYMEGVTMEWCLERRWSIEREITQATLLLADARMRIGQWQYAANDYYRAIEREPFEEIAFRGLMRAQAAQGDRAAAILTYNRLVDRLSKELGVDPDPQTTALLHAIRTDHT